MLKKNPFLSEPKCPPAETSEADLARHTLRPLAACSLIPGKKTERTVSVQATAPVSRKDYLSSFGQELASIRQQRAKELSP